MKKKNNNFRYLSIVNLNVPDFNIIVSVNNSKNKLENFLNKNKQISKDAREEILKECCEEGFAGKFMYLNSSFGFLEIEKWEDNWFSLDVLNHELAHMVDFVSNSFTFPKETEFKAYLQECSFKIIRRLLYDKYHKK